MIGTIGPGGNALREKSAHRAGLHYQAWEVSAWPVEYKTASKNETSRQLSY